MKKRFGTMLLTAVFILLFTLPAFGDSLSREQRVYDYADLFSYEEEEALQKRAEQIIEQWDMDMIFLTTEDTEGLEAKYYAAEFFTDHDFGIGEDADGIIMIVDMGERDAQIVTHGKAIDIFTDYYIDKIWNEMAGDLSDGAYFTAMNTLCDRVEYYNGEYEKYQNDPNYVSEYQQAQNARKKSRTGAGIAVSSLLSALISLFSVKHMQSKYRNIQPYTDGRAYLKENGMTLTKNQDVFAGTHTSRTPIPKDNGHGGGSSWGGSSSTFSSGGSSFGGGGGKF